MSAIDTMTIMKEQKPIGANAALTGKMPTGSSKSGSPDDFIGMMQITMAEYQDQNHTEDNLAADAAEHRMAKFFPIKKNHQDQENRKTKAGEGIASPVEITARPDGENGTDGDQETIAVSAFSGAFIEKMTAPTQAASVDEAEADSLSSLKEAGKKVHITMKDIFVLTNKTAGDLGDKNTGTLAQTAMNDVIPAADNAAAIPENKEQIVTAPEGKGSTPGEMKAVVNTTATNITADAASEINPADQSLQTKNGSDRRELLAGALEGKGIPKDVVTGIMGELGQAIATERQGKQYEQTVTAEQQPKQPEQTVTAAQQLQRPEQAIPVEMPRGEKQVTPERHSVHADHTALSFRQAAVAILEKKGFSAAEIKEIMNKVDQAGVSSLPPAGRPSPDRTIFIQESFIQKEIIREPAFGSKKIHQDIYQKEASLDKFGRENVEARVKINPLDKKTDKHVVDEGPREESLAEPDNPRPPERKNVFAGLMKEAGHKQTPASSKDINAGKLEKPAIFTGQGDQGKRSGSAGDATRKTTKSKQDEIILPPGREPVRIQSEHLGMATKTADFQQVKTTTDTSKSVYQNVVDQIREGFSLVANKEGGQVRLNLKPESMGQLDMRIAVRNDSVQIMMTVENEKVHQAMNAHIEDLKTALQNQGLKIDKIEVTLQYQPDQDRSFYQDQANSGFNNPDQDVRHERMSNRKLSFGDDHYPINGQEIIQKQSITEGVSIFA
ncbi:MAG: flagellar hook-length control protein FliK [Syntrophales bacterium]